MSKTSRAAWIAALACAGTAAAPGAAMAAEVVYGVTDQNRLVRFTSDAPGDVADSVQITGLLDGAERIVGIDVRPATDTLYAVTNQNRVYQVNPVTGASRPAINPITTALNGTAFGVDFNPAADALRITSDAEQNLRIRFSDGQTFNDGALNPGNPQVTASAYTNNVPGATSTTLFDIDAASDTLVRQDPPNAGTLVPVGPLGLDAADAVGFDIAADGAAYAALVTAGQQVVNLHRIDLNTGRAAPAAAVPTIVLPEGSGALRGIATAGGTPNDSTAPNASVAFSSTILEQNTATLEPSVSCDESCTVTITASVQGIRGAAARESIVGGAGRETVELRLNQQSRNRIARSGTELIRLQIEVADAAGNRTTQTRESRTQTLAGRRGG